MLANAGYQFETIAANVDERALETSHLACKRPAEDLALLLANAKAQAVSANHPYDMVIGSDQVLICEGRIFSKVKHLTEAADQLSALQGKTHQLISAVACWKQDQPVLQVSDAVDMTMYRLTAREIETYLQDAGSAVLDSVGCYQIEGKGIRLFEDIAGSHFTIMGMPLIPLVRFLRQQRDLQ